MNVNIMIRSTPTSLCAAKIEFMIGIYDAEMSGEAERINILASKFTRTDSVADAPEEVYSSLFMPLRPVTCDLQRKF